MRRKFKPTIVLFPTLQGLEVTMEPALANVFYPKFIAKYHLQMQGDKTIFMDSVLSIEQLACTNFLAQYRITSKNDTLIKSIRTYIQQFAKRRDRVIQDDKIIIDRNYVAFIEKERTRLETELKRTQTKLERANNQNARLKGPRKR